MPRVLSTTYQKLIRDTLSDMDKDTVKLEFIEELNKTIGIKGFLWEDKKFKQLISVHNDKEAMDILDQYRSGTSILFK